MAQMRQSKGGIGILVAAALAVLAFGGLAKKKSDADDGGNGGNGAGGGVIPSGSIQSVGLKQEDVFKAPGELITALANVLPTTTREGVPVLWPYAIDMTLLTARGGTVLVNKRAYDGPLVPNISLTLAENFVMPSGDSKLEVRIAFWAAKSDLNGQPHPTEMTMVAQSISANRIAPQNSATPSGSITSVVLSRGGMRQRARLFRRRGG